MFIHTNSQAQFIIECRFIHVKISLLILYKEADRQHFANPRCGEKNWSRKNDYRASGGAGVPRSLNEIYYMTA